MTKFDLGNRHVISNHHSRRSYCMYSFVADAITFLEVFPRGEWNPRTHALTVSPRVRVSFPLGSIPVAGRGNTPPPGEISPSRGGKLFPPGEHFQESYCTVKIFRGHVLHVRIPVGHR
jgi:hypothetical protein